MSEATKERADAVDSTTFVEKYIPLQREGLSGKEIAGKLGMNEQSFNNKLSTMRTELFVATSILKVGDKEISGEDYVASKSDVVDDEGKPTVTFSTVRKDIENGNLKVVKSGIKLPSPAGARKKRDLAKLGELAASLMGAVDEDEDSDTDSE